MAGPMGWSHDLRQKTSTIREQPEVEVSVTRQYVRSDHEVVYILVHAAGYYRVIVIAPGADTGQAVIAEVVDARYRQAWDKAKDLVRKWREGTVA